jgi:hypothetical protein
MATTIANNADKHSLVKIFIEVNISSPFFAKKHIYTQRGNPHFLVINLSAIVVCRYVIRFGLTLLTKTILSGYEITLGG